MHDYEMVLVIDGSTSPEDATKIAEGYTQLIQDKKGKILHFNYWERRRLGYQIKNKLYGYYFVIFFSSDKEVVKQIHKELAIDELALKCLILKCKNVQAEQELFELIKEKPLHNAEAYHNSKQMM